MTLVWGLRLELSPGGIWQHRTLTQFWPLLVAHLQKSHPGQPLPPEYSTRMDRLFFVEHTGQYFCGRSQG